MQDKVLRGPTTKFMAKMGVGEYFWLAAENYGERICQIDAYTHNRESFNTVRIRALRVSIQLKRMGVQPKDVVMLSCANNLDNVVPALAGFFLGAYVCSSETSMELFDVNYLLTQVRPKVIFVIEENLKIIEESIQSLEYTPQICVIGQSRVYPQMYDMETSQTEQETVFKPVTVDVKETAFIVFSSGTTALPKGVYMSHLGAMSVACNHKIDEISFIDYPVIQPSTFFWISGIWAFSFCLIYGQPRIIGPDISATKYLQLVNTYKIRNGFIYGHLLYDLANIDRVIFKQNDASSIECLTMGGSITDPQIILQLRKLFPGAIVVQTYAATELGCSPTNWIGADRYALENKITSVGKPNYNTEIKIVDVETREPLGANQKGEILVKSPYRMNGFCNNDSSEIFDNEGYLKIGDLGYYDEDGYVYIIDRLNDIFKFQRHRIAPSMIETVLMKHPAIKEAVVFGVPHHIDICHPAAYIVLNSDSYATGQEIQDFIKTHMSDIYLLRGGIKFINNILRNSNGKVTRSAVKKLFLSSD